MVVLGVHIKESQLLDALSRGVARDGGNINHTESSTVVGLVGDAALDVLVVVDTVLRRLVNAGLFGVLQIPDVPDVGGRVAVVEAVVLLTGTLASDA